MPWFKVDDGFHGHPKVMDLSLAAVGLWTLAGTWCANYLTDGEIPLKAIQRLGGTKRQAKELVSSGLWDEKPSDVYQFRDWNDYQPTKEVVEAERAAARKRMADNRAKGKGTSKAKTPESSGKTEDVQANNDGTEPEPSPELPLNEPETEQERSEEVRLTPTQPGPAPPANTKEADASFVGPRRRATRISEDFMPTSEMIQWATAAAPGVDLRVETEKFINYWIAKAGKDATKLDWGRTWKNWILNSNGRGPGGGGNQQPRMDHGDRMTAKAESMIARMNGWDSNQQPAQLELGA